MVEKLEMQPVAGPIRGTIRPPGSKSLTNRALVVAALAQGRSRLVGALDSQDTRVMVDGLQRLGIVLSHDVSRETIEIEGCQGRPPAGSADIWLENSGTSIRFLTTVCCLGHGTYRLDGNARMRERPIADLTSALSKLGIRTRCERNNGCPPVVVEGAGISGGALRVGGEVSSQFLSALLMACPAAIGPVAIDVAGQLVSQPYVEMTLKVCEAFGVSIERTRSNSFQVRPQMYRGREYVIEPDASAASYFLAAAAATGGEVTIPGLSQNALQGDVGFAEVLRQMGCSVEYGADRLTVRGAGLRGVDVDMNGISDTAQTLAAIAPFARGPTRIRNVAHMRHKETDRVAALATELRRIGQKVEEHTDGLTIEPAPVRPATIETYDDHRMAMSFAVTGLVAPGITIANPSCTAKTYPRFFDDLAALVGSS
ncbi:MAG: 3-phosphoshikimate 1-carboxyvinyltransferase [Planctomycetia bacterium]|nr:3-phosphoshikimate 1-carboxyvinyltransferase [Planctomycetia bacterium]